MLFLTWNLKGTERAFRLVLDHLRGVKEPFVAAFQELPEIVDSKSKAVRQTLALCGNHVQCLGVIGSLRAPGRLGLFSSDDVKATEPTTTDQNSRMAMTVVDVAGRSSLRVVGIHAIDRRNAATEYARGVWGALARLEIETFWKPNRPLVVLGDFNADPYDPEVSARKGLFALRDRDEVRRNWESSLLPEPMRPLYNPMWHLLPESSTRPGGTYLLNSEDRGIRWRLCDQILVSRELVSLLSGLPEILSTIFNAALTTKSGHPSRRISDHLPVQLRIAL